MRINIYNVKCQVQGTGLEEAFLRQYLSFDDASTAFRRGRDGRAKRVQPKRIFLYSILDDTFPTGLLPLVVKKAREEGFFIEFQDYRTPCAKPINADLSWLRDYQVEAVQAALRMGRGILNECTGAGKTIIAIGIIQSIPVRWTFLVHRSGLMYQAAEQFKAHGIDGIGIIGDGECTLGKNVTVATFQTLWSRGRSPEVQELLRTCQGLIVDEVHTAAADSFTAVIDAFGEARYRFGLSGTPLDRSDQRSLIVVGAIGPVIHQTRGDTLVEAGVLARPAIRMVRVDQEVARPTYAGLYGEGVIRSKRRNAALVQMVHAATKPCLCFVTNLKHGDLLLHELRAAGLRVAFVRGDLAESQRSSLKAQLQAKTIDVVVSSVVWQEGVDIPALASVVIGGGGKSTIGALQRIGRGMRRAEGKDTFEVWDVADVGTRVLENQAKARIAAYQREGYPVSYINLVPARGAHAPNP